MNKVNFNTIAEMVKNYWTLKDPELIKKIKEYTKVVFHPEYGL